MNEVKPGTTRGARGAAASAFTICTLDGVGQLTTGRASERPACRRERSEVEVVDIGFVEYLGIVQNQHLFVLAILDGVIDSRHFVLCG